MLICENLGVGQDIAFQMHCHLFPHVNCTHCDATAWLVCSLHHWWAGI